MKQQENKIEFFPFPTLVNYLVFKTSLKDFDKEYWTKIAYDYQKTNPKSSEVSNVGGWQSPNTIHENYPFFPLCKYLQDHFYNVYESIPKSIESMWINISKFSHYNAPHSHSLKIPPIQSYSGVIYLSIPKSGNSGGICFLDPLNPSLDIKILPEEGDLLLFPSSAVHYVEPNFTQEDRISIAFNFN